MQKCGLSTEFIRSIYHHKKTFEVTFRALFNTLRWNHGTLFLIGHLILNSGFKKAQPFLASKHFFFNAQFFPIEPQACTPRLLRG